MIDPETSKELILAAKDYVDKVVDAPLSEIGGILGDTVSYWRFKNKINTVLKAKKFLEEKGINPQKILPDIFVPLIEEAGNVENPTLSDKYASLLSCHLNPETQNDVHPSFAKTLSQLSSTDVKILDSLYMGLKQINTDYRKKMYTKETVISKFNLSEKEVLLSFQNIWRLGICDHGDALGHLNRDKNLVITDFGWSFMTACNTINN